MAWIKEHWQIFAAVVVGLVGILWLLAHRSSGGSTTISPATVTGGGSSGGGSSGGGGVAAGSTTGDTTALSDLQGKLETELASAVSQLQQSQQSSDTAQKQSVSSIASNFQTLANQFSDLASTTSGALSDQASKTAASLNKLSSDTSAALQTQQGQIASTNQLVSSQGNTLTALQNRPQINAADYTANINGIISSISNINQEIGSGRVRGQS